METVENISQESPLIAPVLSENGKPVLIEPDLDFIQSLNERGGDSLKKCIQCGTCSATCALSPDPEPFPRKEMAWAIWGMKDRLLTDPDVWLCHQCNDCSTRCPRGARPGDVLAAVRQEGVRHYAFPRFLGKWANEPQCIPLLLGIPAALLTAALLLKNPIENALHISPPAGEKIVYAYSSVFPHWLLNTFFFSISILVLLATVIGVVRFWRAMKAAAPEGIATPVKSLGSSIISALKNIITHDKFTQCTTEHPRLLSHMSVFFGFIALSVVSLWVITSGINPLLNKGFIYPFGFWNPWKMLANVGGATLLGGCLLMIYDRMREGKKAGTGSYFDWAFLAMLLIVVGTGFFTEVLHYLRLEPHRHIIYFAHLVFVCALLLYLPYSKFAHLIYRTTAMVYAEYTGREMGRRSTMAGDKPDGEKEGNNHIETKQELAVAGQDNSSLSENP